MIESNGSGDGGFPPCAGMMSSNEIGWMPFLEPAPARPTADVDATGFAFSDTPQVFRDDRDLVIATLAESEAGLSERVVVLEVDNRDLRGKLRISFEILSVSMGMNASLTYERDRAIAAQRGLQAESR